MSIRNLFIPCDCGCGRTIQFTCFLDDGVNTDVVLVDFLESKFYSQQLSLFARLSDVIRHVKNKCFFDIVVTKRDLLRLNKFLQRVRCKNCSVKNRLNLTISSEYNNPDDPTYIISLDGDIKVMEVLFAPHKLYQFEINEKIRCSLISSVNIALDIC